jgi:hypothetical protein
MSEEFSGDDLLKAVQGDFTAFADLLKQPHETIQARRTLLPELVLTAKAVRQVLQALQRSEVSPEVVQRWASFVRRGFVTGTQAGPVIPIDVEYEASVEEQIADAIARLDELGDSIDGEIRNEELAQMIRSLRPFPEEVA